MSYHCRPKHSYKYGLTYHLVVSIILCHQHYNVTIMLFKWCMKPSSDLEWVVRYHHACSDFSCVTGPNQDITRNFGLTYNFIFVVRKSTWICATNITTWPLGDFMIPEPLRENLSTPTMHYQLVHYISWARKCIDKINLFFNQRFLVAGLGESASKNLQSTTKIIHLCISLPLIAMDNFFFLLDFNITDTCNHVHCTIYGT